jgi:hypothetical protein
LIGYSICGRTGYFFIAQSLLENYFSDTCEYTYIEKLETEDETNNKYRREDGYYYKELSEFIKF